MDGRNADAPLAAEGSMLPRAPPAPSSRQRANAAPTGSGSISLPHIPGVPCRGNVSTPCVPRGQVVAIFRRGAFSGGDPWHHSAAVPFSGARRWQNAREMRSPGVRQWRDLAAMRSRAAGHGKILLRCVPGLPAMARSRCDAFPGGDPWHFFRLMRSRRGLGREKRPFLAEYRRHASETSRLWQDMRAVHPKSPANGRSGIHRAKILPGRGPFRCACPSNHARRADLAVIRRLNEKGSGKAKKLSAFWQEHVQK